MLSRQVALLCFWPTRNEHELGDQQHTTIVERAYSPGGRLQEMLFAHLRNESGAIVVIKTSDAYAILLNYSCSSFHLENFTDAFIW